MEVSEIITIVREDYLDDTFDGWETATAEEKADQFLWSDKALLRYLTEAQRQACNRTDFLYDDTSGLGKITLKAGVRDYKINQKINVIEEVIFDASKKLTHISKEERDRYQNDWRNSSVSVTNSTPYYVIRGRKLFVYPMPQSEDDGKKLQLSIWHQPVDPIGSVSDELSIPEEYHRDLIWWMLYEAYSKQDADGYDKGKGMDYLAQFNNAFGDYVPSEVRLNQLQEPEGLRTRPVNYLSPSKDRNEWYG